MELGPAVWRDTKGTKPIAARLPRGRHEGILGRLPSGTGGEDPAGDPGCRAALSRAPEHMPWNAKQGTIRSTERRFVSADSFLEGPDAPQAKVPKANRPRFCYDNAVLHVLTTSSVSSRVIRAHYPDVVRNV